MNKLELVNAMAAESGLAKADSKKALEALMTSIASALKSGEKVSLAGFGTFYVSERAERVGINPSTKERIIIPSKKIVKFKPSAELGESVSF